MACHVDFDFDLMARLAKEDPVAFARKREELIQDLISTFRHPEDGHRMQFEIDLERARTAPGEKTYIAMAKRLSLLLMQMSNLFADIQAIASQANQQIVVREKQEQH